MPSPAPAATPVITGTRAELAQLLAYRRRLVDEIAARTQQPGQLEPPWLRRRAEAEIAALVGVAPVARDKGRRKGRRAVLYMAAVAVSRHRNRLAGFYRRLVGRGKPKMPAPVAIGRTMIVTLNAMVTTGTAWKAEMALAT